MPNRKWEPGLDLQLRSMALIGIAVDLWLLATIVRGVLFHVPHLVRPVAVPPNPRHGPNWYSLGIGAVMVLTGIYISFRPEKLARWAQSTMPHRKFGDQIGRRSLWAARIAGVLWVLVALQAVIAGLKYIP